MRIGNQDIQTSLSSEQAIPRIVYSTVRKKSVRKAHFYSINEFRKNNPEYKFVILDDNEAHDYLRSKFFGEKILDIFERSTFGPMRADILRVALMLFEGGIYIDISKRLQIPLRNTIPPKAKFVFSHEHNDIPSNMVINTDSELVGNDRKLIVQWCMMSTANNPIFSTMIESIERDSIKYEEKTFENPKQAILELTATYQYTKAVWKHLLTGSLEFTYAGFDFNESTYVLIPNSYSKNPLNRHYASKKNSGILKVGNDKN